MSRAAFISGDWGTSRLRLFLCDTDGRSLAEREGPGVAGLGRDFGEVLGELTKDWDREHGKLPAIFCGMVGSTIGWREVPYLPCPAGPAALAGAALRMTHAGRAIALLPGLSCRNRLDMPDMMRGEETQIAGAQQLAPHLKTGTHILCMPGTHTKWVLLEDGAVIQFQTALSGEVYDVLKRHSVLLGGKPEAETGPGFANGIAAVRSRPAADLTHLLFSTRSRQLAGEFGRGDAAGYLSGLIVGHDIAGARHAFGDEIAKTNAVIVIGAAALAELYIQALAAFGLSATAIAGNAASFSGLKQAYDEIFGSRTHVA